MREMPTVSKAHTENCVTRIKQRHINCRISTRAGVRLNIDISGIKQLLCAINSKLLSNVDELATPVITLTRITFRVFIRQY